MADSYRAIEQYRFAESFRAATRIVALPLPEPGPGEVLVRRVRGGPSRAIPMQIQVLEPDYLDPSRDGARGGNEVREGIEYDPAGRRVAYWLFDRHPGEWRTLTRATLESRRVPASEVLHVYRQDRPGQMRGVSWFAPIALQLQDLADHQEAQLLRQKIAALSGTKATGSRISIRQPVTSTLPGHPFFVGTLFQPERRALRGEPVPLAEAFVRACPGRGVELGGSAGEGGWVDFAFDSYTEVEALLARLREAGAGLVEMRLGEPDLERVFVEVMNRA